MRSTPAPAGPADARRAGLRHVSDDEPGIRRLGRAPRFRYVGPDGRPVRSARTLGRIRGLAIPPAWTAVWISADPRGHLQATGRDARGRKQPRYHPAWREARDETKFHRTVDFVRALPRLRARVARDLAGDGEPTYRRVVATIVRLLETTLVRVGNDEYARENGSYGLTTLRDRHLRAGRGGAVLRFAGKGGKEHDVSIEDRRVAHIVRRCRDLPGQRLFQFVGPDGRPHPIGSADVNEYVKDATGDEFTAKDFRTWGATLLALHHLARRKPPRGVGATRRLLNEAIDAAAASLRNTRAVCRSSYVHPAVTTACEDGSLWAAVERCARVGRCPRGLRREEAVALRFLLHAGRRSRRRAERAAVAA